MQIYTLILLAAFIFCAGCADMDVPQPMDIVRNPIGSDSAKIGMSRTEVLGIYGEPDSRTMVNSDDWEGGREEWFYAARISALPVNAGYLSEDLYLYFDGNSLTNVSNRSIGMSSKE